jgi:hypothetical protein
MLELRRFYKERVTIGDLVWNNEIICHTFELTKTNGCIPEAIYDLDLYAPTKKIPYLHLGFRHVIARTGIRIHVANYLDEIQGCVAVCTDWNNIDEGRFMGTKSGEAFKKLMASYDTNHFSKINVLNGDK